MDKYKVSIILPVYNVEKYLRDCMDTLVNQTLKEVEIIVVNDGSPDNCLSILESYEAEYGDKVKVYTTENRGVSHARNFAIEKAIGDYIMFVDSDDYIALNMCEQLYSKAIEDHNDLVICSRYNIYENRLNGQLISKVQVLKSVSQNFKLLDKKYELAHIPPFPWGKLFKRELLSELRFPENMRFEDLVLSYEVAVNAECIGVIKDPLYYYRRTTQTGFLNSFSESTFDILKALKMLFEYMEQKDFMKDFYDELIFICARHFLLRYPAFFAANNLGQLKLKLRIINETQDFLDSRDPEWRKNHYLLYTSDPYLRNKLSLYTNKKRMIRFIKASEAFPRICLPLYKLHTKMKAKWIRNYKKLKMSKNKKKYIIEKLTFLKFFSRPTPVKYTSAYNKYAVKDKVILLESKHGVDLAGNIFYLLQELATDTYADFKVYLVAAAWKKEEFEKLLNRYHIDKVKFVKLGSRNYFKLLASAKYLVTDTSFPSYYIKKKDQIYLNTWHGTPLKGMGRSVTSREYGLGNIQRNFLIADYLLYQNEFSKNVFMKDYMIDKVYKGTILNSGYPRNVSFFKTERYEQIRNELDINNNQVMVYMPTWRGLLHKKENKKQIKIIYNYLLSIDEKLNDNQILYVKLHPFLKGKMDYNDFVHIKTFPKDYETYDFLNATDLLITDYSSIMFDYAVSKKKIILFTYDREEYLTGRGMYLDLNQVELPKADTVDELIEEINNKEFGGYPKFFKEFCSLDHKECAKNICEKVILNRDVPMLKTERIQVEPKVNILIYLRKIPCISKLEEKMLEFNKLDTDNFNYFICFRAERLKKKSHVLGLLNEKIFFIPLQSGLDITISEKVATILFTKFSMKNAYINRKLEALTNREMLKNFGELEFTFDESNKLDWMISRIKK